MFKVAVVLISGALVLSSCASKVHRGVVAMKVDDNTAHVGLTKNEVTIGDHVELYGNRCTKGKTVQERQCEKYGKGHGVVTGVMNENYSVVKFDSGVSFQEGDFVEKHSH